MASSTTLVLGDLIEETLDLLLRVSERPRRLVIGAFALVDQVDNSFVLSEGSLEETDVAEFGGELMLVTGKTADTDPVYTVARGYLGTLKQAWPTGSVGGNGPQFPRYQIQRVIEQSISALSTWLPRISTEEYQRETAKQYVELPENTIAVLRVQNVNSVTFRFGDVAGWDFIEDLPEADYPTTKILKVASAWRDTDNLLVTRQVPYEWVGVGDEDDTIDLPITGDDLPMLYAAARLATGRELSRLELDKVEEWNHEAAIRQGVNLRQVRDLWTDFYRRLDEVRRQQRVPRTRPYRRMHTATRSN